MADPIQRVNYFKNQFLHVEDFTAEQAYHLEMRRRHNRTLHTWGIAGGLQLSFVPDGSAVTVRAGTAIDNLGHDIVLVEDVVVDLADIEGGRDVWLTIAYEEEPTREQNETGVKGNTRIEERPKIERLLTKPAEGIRLVLGRVVRGGASGTQITQVDSSVRSIAGAFEGDVLLTPRDPAVPADDYVALKWASANQADLVGSLRVRKFSATSPDGNLSVDGSLAVGSSGQAAGAPLDVRGAGRIASLAFTDADGAPYPGGAIGMANDIEGATKWLRVGGITDAGARRLALTADHVFIFGNLGIGVTAPTHRLHVADSTGIRQNRLYLSGGVGGNPGCSLSFNAHRNAANTDWTFPDQSTTAVTLEIDSQPGFPRFDVYMTTAAATTNWARRFAINGETGMTLLVPSGGSVGVGVADPQAKLDVTGGDIRWGASRLNMDQGGSIELGGTEETAGRGTPYIDFHYRGLVQDYNVRIMNDANGRMEIDAPTLWTTGNVGIATNAPARGLHVEGSEILSTGLGAGLSFGDRSVVGLNDAAAGNRWVLYSDQRVARLWTPTRGDVLSITNDGNVGLGTGSPGAKLHVVGDIIFGGAVNGTLSTPARMHINSGELLYLLNKSGVIVSKAWGGNGNLVVEGVLNVLGGKIGYVVDQFANAHSEALELGDVVVVAPSDTPVLHGLDDNIPLAEIDLTERANNTGVCGIVSGVYAELKPGAHGATRASEADGPTIRPFEQAELEQMTTTSVEPGQVGLVVTLGAFAHCKVDADIAPIEIGDLLTTSPTRGHAQKVLDKEQAVGAILGKALAPLSKGKGKIPVLVTLH